MEFALLLLPLAILVLGTVDLGRAYSLKSAATNMAREGAFVALSSPCPVSGPEDAARNENPDLRDDVTVRVLDGAGTSGYPIDCLTPPPPGSQVTVAVSTEMDIITPLIGAITGSPVVITGTASVQVP